MVRSLLDIIQFQQFDNIELIAKYVVEGFITGLHKSPFHGFSVEFAEHRLYNAGESTKHIDWKLFARTEKLFVKRYEEETNLRSHIVIDTSSSMHFPKDNSLINKQIFSTYCAAALIYLLRKQRDAVGLSLFSDKVDWHTDAKLSLVHAQLLYNKLGELIKPNNTPVTASTDIANSLHQIADSIHKRSLVIVFSDMLDTSKTDEVFSALQHLKFNGHEVLLFNVKDKHKELSFNFENRPHKFIDMESGNSIKLNPFQIKEAYQKKASDYEKAIYIKCGQYKIDVIDADIQSDFSQVLIPYLIKRTKLH